MSDRTQVLTPLENGAPRAAGQLLPLVHAELRQLGGALLDQKTFAEAEPPLSSGHEGVMKREARIRAASRGESGVSLSTLVSRYVGFCQPDQAAHRRKKLDEQLTRPAPTPTLPQR